MAVSEDEHVVRRERDIRPGLSSGSRTGFVDDREPKAIGIEPGYLRQAGAQVIPVIVSPYPDHAGGAGLELVEQLDSDPVTGVHDDIRIVHRPPELVGERLRAPGQVSVRDQQESSAHWRRSVKKSSDRSRNGRDIGALKWVRPGIS